MPVFSNRYMLTTLAVVPPILIYLTEPWRAETATSSLVIGVLAGVVSLSALSVSVRGLFAQLRKTIKAYRLIDPQTIGTALSELPEPAVQRVRLQKYLSDFAQERPGREEPDTYSQAMGHALNRILSAWGVSLQDASDEELSELTLLADLVEATPGDAGRLANHFLKPEQMLAIRDELTAAGDRRRRFERQRDTFEATRAIWQMRNRTGSDLRGILERMAMPDIDLWHHIIDEHDPLDPMQSAAAQWCVQQAACDKATVALYLRRMLVDGHLVRAIEAGDPHVAEAVKTVIGLSNNAWYGSKELDLPEVQDKLAAANALHDTLDTVAATLMCDKWQAPVGLFDLFEGRPVQARANWCLHSGTLTAPPKLEDYVELAA